MTNPENSPPPSKDEWQGFREVDRAIAENRLTAYSWKKAWADQWSKAGLILFAVLFLAFVIYVVIYDGFL